MNQSGDLQKAQRATTPGVALCVALLHILQVVQMQTNVQNQAPSVFGHLVSAQVDSPFDADSM